MRVPARVGTTIANRSAEWGPPLQKKIRHFSSNRLICRGCGSPAFFMRDLHLLSQLSKEVINAIFFMDI